MLRGTSIITAVALLLSAAGAAAQTPSPQPLGVHKDWAAFTVEEEKGKTCYIASKPSDTAPDNVKRGDVWVLVTHRPWKGVHNEVSVYTGYPYEKNSTVTVNIDGTEFELFTHGETAWARTPEEDQKLVESMRKGLEMVVTGVSSRGTTTTDTYSLSGFTAAHEEIDGACEE